MEMGRMKAHPALLSNIQIFEADHSLDAGGLRSLAGLRAKKESGAPGFL